MILQNLLDQLDTWKSNFGRGDSGELEALLRSAAERRPETPGEAIRLHETLLFLRAYPRSVRVARLADRILFDFAKHVARLREAGADMEAFEAAEVSGIAGSALGAVFSYEFAVSLAARHAGGIDIGWDRCDELDRIGPVLARILPLLGEDWPVEAHAPFREWIAAARPPHITDLAWLLQQLEALPEAPAERAKVYGSMGLPLTWEIGNSASSRSRLRLPGGKLFTHREPLLRRGDVSLERELQSAPLPVRRVLPEEARRVLNAIVDTSAMRYRELHGFSHPDVNAVDHADLGRGVDLYFFGVPPAQRLPFRAYHGGMFFKNGVPAGYVELLSLCERAEVGFNLYYTFREGESAWLYAQLLRLFHQVLGVNCFSVDPYQIGLENPEAIDSGAFWFYRKLGFRPVEPEAAALVAKEEARMRRKPGSRSSKRTLERLAESYLVYDGPGAVAGAWDRFRVRNLALAVQRAGGNPKRSGLAQLLDAIPESSGWSAAEKRSAARILRAKYTAEESVYLREMQGHAKLRAALLRLGETR